MNREELIKKLFKLQTILNNVQQAINNTNIPLYVIAKYIKDEGIDLDKINIDNAK